MTILSSIRDYCNTLEMWFSLILVINEDYIIGSSGEAQRDKFKVNYYL